MARIEEVQAKGAGEGQHRGADDRLWAELKAALGLRSRMPEEDRDGGGPASPEKPSPHPPLQHRTIRALRFSTRWDVLRSLDAGSSIEPRPYRPRIAAVGTPACGLFLMFDLAPYRTACT